MVVDDLNLFRAAIAPYETNPPLVIDADRMLSLTVAFERLKPIAGWLTQIIQRAGIIEQQQLTACLPLYGTKARHILVPQQARRGCVPERADHINMVFRIKE